MYWLNKLAFLKLGLVLSASQSANSPSTVCCEMTGSTDTSSPALLFLQILITFEIGASVKLVSYYCQ
jgi:hypothetical protein